MSYVLLPVSSSHEIRRQLSESGACPPAESLDADLGQDVPDGHGRLVAALLRTHNVLRVRRRGEVHAAALVRRHRHGRDVRTLIRTRIQDD